MKRLLGILFLLSSFSVSGQSFSEKSLSYEQAIFMCKHDSLRLGLQRKYVTFLVANDSLARASSIMKDILYESQSQEVLTIFLKLALLKSFETSDHLIVDTYLLNIKSEDFSNESLQYASIYYLTLHQLEKADIYINELQKRCLLEKGFLDDTLSIKRKKPRKAKRLNKVLPGLGIIYASKTGMGVTHSMLIAAGIYFTQHHLRKGHYVTSIFTGLTFTSRMYLGGINFATNSVHEFNHDQVETYVRLKILILTNMSSN